MSTQSVSSTAQQDMLREIPVDPNLTLPEIYDVGPDQKVPVQRVYDGYNYHIPAYPGMAVGQEVITYVTYVGNGFFGDFISITEENFGEVLKIKQVGFRPPHLRDTIKIEYVVEQKDGSKTRSPESVYTITF